MDHMDGCPINNKPCCNLKKISFFDEKTGEQVWICDSCGQPQHDSLHPPKINQLINMIDDFFKKTVLAKCSICGMTAEELVKSSRFGCPSCYDNFRHMALRYFDRCQVSSAHEGKRLSQGGVMDMTIDLEFRIEALREKMEKAVAAENYEVASVIKKKIEQLIEAKGKNAL